MQDLAENEGQSHPLYQGANTDRSDVATHGPKGHQRKNLAGTKPSHTPLKKWALRTAHSNKEKVGGPSGRPADLQVGRPAHGPHRLQASMWHSLIGSQRRFQGFPADSTAEERVAPHYIYEGRGSISRHHQASSYQVTLSRCSSSSLVEVLGLEEFGFES